MKTTISSSTSRNLNELTQILDQQALQVQDWQAEAATFVPLLGSWYANSEEEFNLEDEVQGFLKSDRRVLLLLGDSGAGKSLYTQKLAMELVKQNISKNNSDINLIPVWISLPSLKDPTHQAIEELLSNLDFSAEEIKILRMQGRFVFILDAYDEIHTLKNLYVTNQLQNWNAKIIITCRREYLYQVDNYALYFLPYLNGIPQRHAYQEMIVKPFNAEQITHYLQQYVKAHPNPWPDAYLYQQAIDDIPGLKTFLATPFLLKMALTVLPDLVEQYKTVSSHKKPFITQCVLYDAFIEQWFNRQEKKLKDNNQIPKDEDIKPQFWSYAKSLAKAMRQAQCTQITYAISSDLFASVQGNSLENHWKKWLNPQNAKIKLLQTACLVREVNSQHYAFIHSSLQEYFVARELYETLHFPELEESIQLQSDNNNNNSNFKATPIKQTIQADFNQRLLIKEANILQFLADQVKEDENFKAILFAQVEASKQNEAMQIAAANAITVLNYAGISFAGMDLSDVHIPEADLSNANLDSVNFSKANLQKVRLNLAWLRRANLQGADLTNAKLGEKPISYYESAVNMIAWHPEGRYLAVSIGKDVIIEDTFTGIRQTMQGHYDTVTSIAWSENGKLASGSDDKSVIIWEVKKGKAQQILREHAHHVTNVAWSQDGRLASCDAKRTNDSTKRDTPGTVIVWDLARAKPQLTLQGQTNYFTCVAWSAEGELASSDGRDIILWDLVRAQPRLILNTHSDKVNCIAWSINNELASAGMSVVIWDLGQAKPKQILKGHTGKINSIAWGTNEELASGSSDKIVIIWDLTQNKIKQKLQAHTDSVNCIAWNKKGDLASASNDRAVILWDLSQNEVRHTLQGGHTGSVTSLACNAKGELATSSDDKTVIVWDLIRGMMQQVLKGHKNSVTKIAWSESGKLASSSSGDSVIIWDLELGKPKHIFPLRAKLIKSIAWNKQEDLAASSGNTVIVWKQEQEKMSAPQVLQGHVWDVSCVAWSVNNDLASGSNDKKVIIWDLIQGKPRHILKGHSWGVNCIAWSTNNELASGGDDRTMIVWDVMQQRAKHKYISRGHDSAVTCVSWSPSGKLASSSRDSLVVWNLEQGQVQHILKGHSEGADYIAWSTDEELASSDGSNIIVWDLERNKPKAKLTGYFAKITSLAWITYNDQTFLVSGSYDNVVKVWQRRIQNSHEVWHLFWSSHNLTSLFAEECQLEGSFGLTVEQIRLFKEQKQAKGSVLLIESGWTKLHVMVANGELADLKRLLGEKVNLEATTLTGLTPLHLAAQHNRIITAYLLLKNGANAQAKTKNALLDGNTPLQLAMRFEQPIANYLKEDLSCWLVLATRDKNIDCIKYLIADGFPVDAVDAQGFTSLCEATRQGDEALIKLLLIEAKANPNVQDKEGLTPLHYAIKQGNAAVVKLLLLKAKTNPDVQDKEGLTPLHYAVKQDQAAIIELLLVDAKANPDIQNKEGLTPLHYAVKQGHRAIVELLLEVKANPDIQDKEGLTLLHYAIKQGNAAVVKLLLVKTKANNLDIQDKEGLTPLHCAVKRGHTAIVELLLAAKANSAQTSEERLLLAQGIDKEAKDVEGWTALHIAAQKGYASLVELLLARRMNKEAKTNTGATPLHIAAMNGRFSVVSMLLAQGANINAVSNDGYTALHRAAYAGHLNVVRLLVEKQADIHARSLHDFVIHCAVHGNNYDIINLLLDKGAVIDALDSEGNTPLEWASEKSENGLATMELLLKRGANLFHVNNEKNTLLHLCAKRGQKGGIMEFLLERIDYKATNKDNKTAAELAIENGYWHIASLIEKYEKKQQHSTRISKINSILEPPVITTNTSTRIATEQVTENQARSTTKNLTKYFEQLELQAREAREVATIRPARAATLSQKNRDILVAPNTNQNTIITVNQYVRSASNVNQSSLSEQTVENELVQHEGKYEFKN